MNREYAFAQFTALLEDGIWRIPHGPKDRGINAVFHELLAQLIPRLFIIAN